MSIYNVNLETNICYEDRAIGLNGTIDEIISRITEACLGLENPSLGINCEEDYDLPNHELVVCGTRAMSNIEREQIIEARAKEDRYKEHMKNFKG